MEKSSDLEFYPDWLFGHQQQKILLLKNASFRKDKNGESGLGKKKKKRQ